MQNWGSLRGEGAAEGVRKQDGSRKTNATPCVWEDVNGHVGKYVADALNYYSILARGWCIDSSQGYEV